MAAATGGMPGAGNESGGSAPIAGTSSGGNAGTTVIGEAGEAGMGVVLPPPVTGALVDASEATLRSLNGFQQTTFAPLVHYAVTESVATLPNRPTPSYMPYDASTNGFWDNLVAEQLQARIGVVLLVSRGAYQLTSTDLTGPGGGAENPRRLSAWVSAVSRAGASNQFQAACRLEVASLQDVAGNFHGTGGTPVLDLSKQSDWSDIFWQRGIKPWFDTIPMSYWTGPVGPVIDFSAVTTDNVSNAQGNASKLMSSLVTQFVANYGKTPSIYLDSSWFSLDTTLAGSSGVSGNCPDYAAPSTPFAYTDDCGGVVPGYINPGFYDSTSSAYMNAAYTIPRFTVDAYSNRVFTLETGLSGAAAHASPFTILYSYIDISNSAGYYRSDAWDYPNRYLNLVRRYTDPPTRTVMLQAENCDKYRDTTAGNSGKVFSRSGDLDIRALSGSGWAVTNTAPGEWIEFDNLDFSAGNYEILARYSESSSGSGVPLDELDLSIDGAPLAPVILPASANVDTFQLTSLGNVFVPYGPHNLRVTFETGFVDLDYLFIKKIDHTFALRASNNDYLSASLGGGSDLNAGAAAPEVWESIMFDDLNGGSLVDGDKVNLMTYNGHYISASAGKVTADKSTPGATESFTVKLISGPSIKAGSAVALLTSDGMHYVGYVSGTKVDASGSSIGAQQTFVLQNDDQ